MAAVGRAPEAHRGRLKPKFRQPSTWLVSPELCARSRDRAAKHAACTDAAGRQGGASVGAIKGYQQAVSNGQKRRDIKSQWVHKLPVSDPKWYAPPLMSSFKRAKGPRRSTLLKAHLANIRSTSGLPKLDPFSLYVGGKVSVRGGASSEALVGVA